MNIHMHSIYNMIPGILKNSRSRIVVVYLVDNYINDLKFNG